MMDIEGCVAIVTGGASGLGEACVRNLAKDGAKVSIFDFAEERAEKIRSELGDGVIFCKTDVTDESAVQAAVDKTIDYFGKIHIGINCAGVPTPAKVLGKEGPMSMDHFNRVLQINLVGTMHVIRLAAEKMLKNTPNEDGERGVIINTASIAAFEGQIGQAAYSASKAGVVGMTLPIAREFADHGIRVVTIAPGIFETPMMAGLPEKVREALNKMVPFPSRLGKPSEFALLVKQIIGNPMLNACTIRLDGALRMAGK
jgi:NAD(P)-dependent dehydrogenase (short-subunit alcohol dehydrogenase family)